MPRKKATTFKCEKCGKAFSMAMHLGRHMTTIHSQAPTRSAPAAKPKRTANAGAANTLVAIINKLQAQRQEHAAAIARDRCPLREVRHPTPGAETTPPYAGP